jgi:serine/threonine protein kinase
LNLQPIDKSGAACKWSLCIPEESILGEGQYGVVWRAKQRRNKRWCAVKDVRVSHRDAAIAARECEIARLVQNASHPCLVNVLEVHEDSNGLCALVMELCPGGDLQTRIGADRDAAVSHSRAYVPNRFAPLWLTQIFMGLEYMHLQLELLFRDLKPANIVFASDTSVKITDFGFGRRGLQSHGDWSFGFPVGSFGYGAPEIFDNDEYDHTADLYSLGVLAWVLLTGGVADQDDPMPPTNPLEEDWMVLAEHLAAPAGPGGGAAGILVEPALGLVRQLTSRNPDERPQHNEIRQHPYIAAVHPPTVGASRSVFAAWMKAQHAN